ncbi:MAG TPA: porphobilinogen synthase [Chthonomonadales bacterium]|nr:porphobilinogen synthase [Chthonomonadales bacterium]
MNADAAGLDPAHRLRRLRRSPALRRLVREHRLSADCLIRPLFVRAGERVREPIAAMPGQFRLSADRAVEEGLATWTTGVPGVLLFGVADPGDGRPTAASDPNGPVQRAIRALKAAVPELAVVTDVCLCAYTGHGHCGVLEDGEVDNDATLPLLAEMAVSHAEAGADVVAPSAMMDGQVGTIREALDEAGYGRVAIMAYAAKYASAYYGPFREAAGSAPRSGDRRSYQMDPSNVREALREIVADEEQGADIVMVKPALAYMDVLRAAREITDLPIAAYSVSGEYCMVKAAAERGWLDERAVVLETLTGLRRAGADIVITYHACEVARWLSEP